MYKKLITLLLLLASGTTLFAQKDDDEDEVRKGGFKKQNLFTGGGVNVSFFNGATVLGVNPVLGYSINRFIDAGIAVNLTYTGFTEFSGDRYRQTVYGPGAFVRLYPVNFLFAQAQYERNFIALKVVPGNGTPTYRDNLSVNSLLLGGGYCTGREGVGSTFYYFSVMVDVTRNRNSPYVEYLQNNTLRAIPIVRAGLNIALFQRRNRNF